MRITGRFALLLCLCIASSWTPSLDGQSTYGTLLGTVRDATGAVVPAATITVTDVSTNLSKTTTTNSGGDYQIPNLLSGTYNVTIVANGFRQLTRRGVPLDPRAEVRVDASLEVGETQQTVEVTASAPVMTTETATVSDVEKGKEITELPINYRANSTSPFNAITTLPGVQVDSGGALGYLSFSVSGNHPALNEVTVDGFSVTSPRNNGPLAQMFPSTEQISELKIASQIASAEYGQVGDISFIGKSGSNAFHGSAFEYLQNDSLDAKPLFTNGKPKKRNNDFGGSISGPVKLPFYNGRDRTFFFFDYERNMQRSASSEVNNVPTAAMLAGDFSSLLPKQVLNNPFTGQPFPGNKIPSSLINPV
jgi:Carboxypeptidase regulatory-like domain/TonB-dependent Receptor Plug Domain